jgi:hypothetical protein
MPYRILLRRDLSQNWDYNDPVLMTGEPGYEIDTRKFKMGDGQTPWSQLPYYCGVTGPAGPTLPYKSYTALLTQTEENDPVATILENTIGDIVWTRLGAGSYLATSDNLFTENKTTIFMTGNSSLVFGIYPSINTPGTEITVETGSPNETHLDQILDNTPIEIRVYN